MRASPVLMAAIALNVVLGAALYFRSSGDASAPSARSSQSDPAALFVWAKQQGLSDDVSYRLALAQLRAQAAAEEPEHYWEPAPERMLARRQREMERLQEIRKQLIGSFGASVTQQAALADVFQPLRSTLPFLSPDKQMALQQILFETSMADTAFVGPRSAGADRRLVRIRELLSDEEFAEYQRRESALATRLANSGFEFTEAEFRAVFDVVATTGLEPRQSLTHLMPAIGRVLEGSRFREFERSQSVSGPRSSWAGDPAGAFRPAR